jgi:hypothetical protein
MPRHEPLDPLTQKAPLRRHTDADASTAEPEAQRHPLLYLHRQLGNAQVARLLAQRGTLPEARLATTGDQQAVRRHEAKEGTIQATPEVGLEGGPISGDLSNRIQAQRGGGSSLDSGTRAAMESALGDRFDDVRIHAGDEADALNRSVSAKAFTTGSDIFFSRNASPSDTGLLAHELTHVVQQRGADVSGGPMTVSPAGDSHEQAADSVASAVSAGSASADAQRVVDEATLARMIARMAPEEEEEDVLGGKF